MEKSSQQGRQASKHASKQESEASRPAGERANHTNIQMQLQSSRLQGGDRSLCGVGSVQKPAPQSKEASNQPGTRTHTNTIFRTPTPELEIRGSWELFVARTSSEKKQFE